MARRRRRGQRLDAATRQAQADSALRYGPQVSALSELLFQARADYHSQLRADQGSARGIERMIGQTIPKVRKDYNRTIRDARREQNVVGRRVNQLGPAANDIKAASIREASGARRRLKESRADATTELRDRSTQARAGAAYAAQAARQEYRQQRAQIGRQIVDVAGQRGLFAATEAASNRKAQRDYRLALRKATGDLRYKKASLNETRRSHRQNERTAARNAATSRRNSDTSRYNATHGPSTKPDRPTRTQRVAAKDKYDRGVTIARQIHEKRPKVKKDQLVGYLTEKLGSRVLATAAAQEVLHGSVGPKTRRRAFHRYGVRLGHKRTKQRRTAVAAQDFTSSIF